MPASTVTLRSRTLLVGFVVAMLFGAAAHGLLAGTPSSHTSQVPASSSAPGPSLERAGLLVGFAHNRAGAIAAATTYVREGQRLFDLPSPQRDAALRTIAASAAADGVVGDQARQLNELGGIAQRGQGPLTWMVTVLATRLDAYTPARARVSLWRVGILSVSGLMAPLAEWTTVDYELVWERGDWRLWSETQVPGPSPIADPNQTPTTPNQWRTALSGFARFPGQDPV